MRRLYEWKFHTRETLSRWMAFDPISELADSGLTPIFLSAKGYALAGAMPQFQSLDELTMPAGRSAMIVVDSCLCYRRTSEVHEASSTTIDRILKFDLERILPMPAGSYMSSSYVVGKGSSPGTVKVHQVALRKSILEPLLAWSKTHGVTMHALSFYEGSFARLPIALSIEGKAFGRERFLRWTKVLGFAALSTPVAALSVAIAVVLTAGWTKDVLLDQSTELAGKVSAIQQRIQIIRSSNERNFDLMAWKQDALPLTSIIEELSRLLPDTAYLENLSADRQTITLDGLAIAPETLISLLESSPHFKEVSFTSPISRSPAESKSRFSLKLIVESRQSESIR